MSLRVTFTGKVSTSGGAIRSEASLKGRHSRSSRRGNRVIYPGQVELWYNTVGGPNPLTLKVLDDLCE